MANIISEYSGYAKSVLKQAEILNGKKAYKKDALDKADIRSIDNSLSGSSIENDSTVVKFSQVFEAVKKHIDDAPDMRPQAKKIKTHVDKEEYQPNPERIAEKMLLFFGKSIF
jgi:hypothetical protein